MNDYVTVFDLCASLAVSVYTVFHVHKKSFNTLLLSRLDANKTIKVYRYSPTGKCPGLVTDLIGSIPGDGSQDSQAG